MKTLCGLLVAIALLGVSIVHLGGCASWHADWEAKCGPGVDPLTKPCSCNDPRTPTCVAPLNDDGDNPSVMTKRNNSDGGSDR
jgi:hypothetical protein